MGGESWHAIITRAPFLILKVRHEMFEVYCIYAQYKLRMKATITGGKKC